MFKSERREIVRRNSRKMKVHGRSIFTIQRAADKRVEKARDAARNAKAFTLEVE